MNLSIFDFFHLNFFWDLDNFLIFKQNMFFPKNLNYGSNSFGG